MSDDAAKLAALVRSIQDHQRRYIESLSWGCGSDPHVSISKY